MTMRRLSRRDVLKASTALAASSVLAASGGRSLRRRRSCPRRRPPARSRRQLIEAAKKEGKVVWYTSVDLPLAEKVAKRVRGQVSGRRRAGRAHRRRARVPAHRPGICRATSTRSTSSTRRTPRTSSCGSATAGSRPTCRRTWPSTIPPSTRTRTGCSRASASSLCVMGYNTDLVKARGRAEELRRPARSEVDRQDRQGASELQRHHPDRDLPDRARHRLGRISRSSPSSGSCRCSPRPIRPRSWRSASAPSWPTASSTACSSSRRAGKPVEIVYPTEGTPLIVGPERHLQERAEPERRTPACRTTCFTAECQQLIIDVGGMRSVHRADQGEGRPHAARRRSR